MNSTKLILIVDDVNIARHATRLKVAGFGFLTDEARSGDEALQKIKITKYAAILMDFNMPGMDGLECTKHIRELEDTSGPHLPVIGLSGNNDSALKQSWIDAGINAYLHKSCTLHELKNELEKWVHGDLQR